MRNPLITKKTATPWLPWRNRPLNGIRSSHSDSVCPKITAKTDSARSPSSDGTERLFVIRFSKIYTIVTSVESL
jgi:hypothetical protein